MTRIHKKRPATADVLLDLPDTYEGTGAIKTPVGNQTVRRFRRGKTWVSLLSGTASVYSAYAFAADFDDREYWVDGTQYGATDSAELVANSAFDTNVSGFVGYGGQTITWEAGGKARATGSADTGLLNEVTGLIVGGRYRLTVKLDSTTNSTYMAVGTLGSPLGVASKSINAGSTGTLEFTATATSHHVGLYASAADYVADFISLKRVAGVNNLPGYNFTRPGEQGMVDSTGAVAYVPPHVPAINDRGYHAYGTLTNIVIGSQDQNNAQWAGPPQVYANLALAPDGMMTADKLAEYASSATWYRYQQVANTIGGVATYSAFYKDIDRRYVRHSAVSGGSSNGIYADVDLQTGTIVNQGAVGNGSLTSASIMDCGGGWYRVTVVGVISTTESAVYAVSTLRDASTNVTTEAEQAYAGTGKAIYVWQHQIIFGNFPDGGPIIRTGAATASIGASALIASVSVADEDQLIFVAATIGSPNGGTSNYDWLASFNQNGSTAARIDFFIDRGIASLTAIIDGAGSPENQTVGVGTGAQRVIAAWRRRAGKWTAFFLVDGVFTAKAEGTANGVPAGINRVEFRYPSNDTHQPDAAIEGAFVKSGTFSGDEVRAILLGYPVESGHVFVAPVSTAAPTITGLTQTGKTLTVSQGSWNNYPFSFTYQWTRNGANIAGATNSTYVLQAADIDQTVSCKVTATNPAGSTVATANNVTGIIDPADAPHLHWRVFFPNAENIGIDEIAFYDETDTNVNAETTAKFSSPTWNNGTPEFAPAKAFDGNNATYWNTISGNPGNAHLGVSFAVPKTIRKVTLRYSAIDRGFSALRIQFSDDMVTWSDYSRAFIPQGKKANYTFHVYKQNMGLLFRFYTTDKDGAVNAAIREIDFNGDVPVGPANGTTAWGGVPAQAVDGDPNTRWISGSEANPILLWRGQSPDIEDYNVVRIRAFYQAGNGDRMPKGFRLAYSADEGDNWTQFADITGPSWVTDNEIRTFPIA